MTADLKLKYCDHEAIRDLLLWHTVVKVTDDTLQLDDGTRLKIRPNEGCGGCISGNYFLEELNDCPVNAITAVEFVEEFSGSQGYYSIFVLAEDRRIRLVGVDGDDGDGWNYGTGYTIRVEPPHGSV